VNTLVNESNVYNNPPKSLAGNRTEIERIADFAAHAQPYHLSSAVRNLYKRNILDSIGCAIAALPGLPFQALREQFGEYRASESCTLIGGGKTSPDQAALFNCALVRYVDLLDTYMSPGGLCHPSDNFGVVLSAAEYAGATGEEFMLALAIAYEIQCRFTAAVPVMAKGFNHALQLAMSAAAGTGKLMGLSSLQIANAIAITAIDNVSLANLHAEPVSQWKGFSPGMTGMRAIYAASLAKRGFTGPLGLVEGPKGLEHMFAQRISANWEDPSLNFITRTVLKKYSSLIHGQPVLEAVLNLRQGQHLSALDVERVRCSIFQAGFDIAGGGSYGSKEDPRLKEQGDYNLKYLIAAALVDGQVGPEQLEPSRIQAPAIRTIFQKIEVLPDEELTGRYPGELCARITIWTKDGRVLTREQLGYEGGLGQPMSWERTVEKFHWLSEAFADLALRNRIIEAVEELDAKPLSKLIAPLTKVKMSPIYPRRHPGIQ